LTLMRICGMARGKRNENLECTREQRTGLFE
jgi:hypothetical protein